MALFDRSFASSVVNSTLATNIFLVPFVKGKWSHVSFVAGQPLGYYSSWPLFAFTHHVMVWYCAEKVYPGVRFTRYAILGDDILITDPKVAALYANLLEDLGVSISQSKSLISSTGCIEFAKRFMVNGLTSDLSPISVRSLVSFFHPHGLMVIRCKHSIERFSTFCRIGGIGYKSLSRIDQVLPPRLMKMALIWSKPSPPLNLWLGRGRPLNPYIHGYLVSHLIQKMKPRDLVLPQTGMFEQAGMGDFLEWSLVRCWVEDWLLWWKWYCVVALDPGVSVETLLEDAPVIPTHWLISRKDENLVRYGLTWKCYDMVGNLGLNYQPGVLPPHPEGEGVARHWYQWYYHLFRAKSGFGNPDFVGLCGRCAVCWSYGEYRLSGLYSSDYQCASCWSKSS